VQAVAVAAGIEQDCRSGGQALQAAGVDVDTHLVPYAVYLS
jgi:hypothetical protein